MGRRVRHAGPGRGKKRDHRRPKSGVLLGKGLWEIVAPGASYAGVFEGVVMLEASLWDNRESVKPLFLQRGR